MNFTRGAVYVDNRNVAYGDGLKNLIAVVVNNIPGLSIQTVTTSTAYEYNATLNYKGLLFSIRNSSNKIYTKVGSVETSYRYLYSTHLRGTVTFMYSEEGIMSFSMTPLDQDYNGESWTVSIIPIEFKLSDGTTKELFWFKDAMVSEGKIGNIPRFIGAGSYLHNLLIDPDSQIQYSFSISGADAAPVVQAKGKSVAVPATFSNSYGEVVSYNIKGSSPIYFIYPGVVDTLKSSYPGTQVIYIGNVPYIGIDYEYFVRT
uniref:Uncharacterized protein n=1 Tax=Siphoviridae sp. ctL7J9 TaxID=2827845 RepID=A0A8S5T5Y6_9CAUD|nr:MAG TPA: hypothetical protein [Siphoviridae sp. ctL7J9]